MADLEGILRERFRFPAFRPHQMEACELLARGESVLLVMPTGAGKSLCYQLPGVARGGNALVISPLISLMEDQVAKLAEQGFRAARIHSGRTREDSNQAVYDWADGNLDFLFIAPERLRNERFVGWLAKRKPNLIAVDEAHCISEWGHDFRPDYRLLGERLLPLLHGGGGQAHFRHTAGENEPDPCPVIALTATATPQVQEDICKQLAMPGAQRLIHGFLRKNIAVEVVELNPKQRGPKVLEVLGAQGARTSGPHDGRAPLPAIVYVPSRKECEALAAQIAKQVPCLPYHAGMTAADRDSAQTAFQAGDVSVIVATIAFGMGIDKSDVRTVIHTALPGTVEGYYQEIGRAGRDGKPSRAILMYSWADKRLHEFFLGRDYPPVADVERAWNVLAQRPRSVDDIAAELDITEQVAATRVDRLLAHGGATIDSEGFVTRMNAGWQGAYQGRIAHREAQLDAVLRFASGAGCRMAALLEHFGDRDRAGLPCGHCDFCAPDESTLKRVRKPNERESELLQAILFTLAERDGRTPKQLIEAAFPNGELDRRGIGELLRALAQAGAIRIEEAEFEKDGRTIRFEKIWLTREGKEAGAEAATWVHLPDDATTEPSATAKKKADAVARHTAAVNEMSPADAKLLGELQVRCKQLHESGDFPKILTLTNKALRTVAIQRPQTLEELSHVQGLGPQKVDAYGATILDLTRKHGPATTAPATQGERKQAANEAAKRAESLPQPDPTIIKALKQWRLQQSKEEGVPAFRILGNKTLNAIAIHKPSTEDDLLKVPGIGPQKLEAYGQGILRALRGID